MTIPGQREVLTMSRKRHISILIVPDDGRKAIGFRLSHSTFKALLVCLSVVIAAIIYGVITYWKAAEVASQAEQLARKNAELEQESAKINQLANILFEIKGIDRRLRLLAGRHVGLQTTEEVEGSLQAKGFFGKGFEEEGLSPTGFRTGLERRPEELAELLERQKQMLRSIPSLWPVHGWVSAEYEEGSGLLERKHLGIDIVAAYGSAVRAAADGVVTFAGWTDDLGYTVIVDHGFGFSTRYGHNSRLLVDSGTGVKRGQMVAFLGSSGQSSAPHLHFEVWKDGRPVNPRDYLLR